MFQFEFLRNRVAPALLAAWALSIAPNPRISAAPETAPPAGLREHTPEVHALVGARIVTSPGETIECGALVIRDGVITAVGAEVDVPGDATVWELSGKTLYPGLIDAYGEIDVAASGGSDSGAAYWNSNVTPHLRVDEAYKPDAGTNAKLRGQGVTARLLAPSGGLIKGASALVATSDDDGRQTILKDRAALYVRLSPARGSSRDAYPNSPMGAVALVRQAFYDARWYREAWQAYGQDPALGRPERSDALAALAPYLDGQASVMIDAADELYFLRANQIAREFELEVLIRGSGEEYRRLDAIRQTGHAVVVPVDFASAPEVGTPEAAMNVSLERLMHWDIAPENAARLEAAGVRIAFTSHGLSDQGKFLDGVRTAVRRGLSPDAALRGLTVTPAELFGVERQLGTLAVGKAAHLIVTDGDLFDKKTAIWATWVDGRRYELKTSPLVDLRGRWDVKLAGVAGQSELVVIQLKGEPHKLSGTLRRGDGEEKLLAAKLDGAQFNCSFKGKQVGWQGVARLSATVSTGEDGTTWLGSVVWADGGRSACTATRSVKDPEQERGDEDASDDAEADAGNEKPADDDEQPASADNKDEEEDEGENEGEDEKESDAEDEPRRALFDVNYPLGNYGLSVTPDQPAAVVFRNATVWTCGPEGKLDNASVVVERGKITAVGVDVAAPEGALEIDASGKHITPGLIDCHSHIATDGGVNESAQTITAEVRIGDFIDPNDVNIYRQVAGGTTCSNILHGSANTIGGQNQVIKLRWGALPEEMKLAGAPPGIKFALGENVKRSNSSGRSSRYPQSRMGVEQLVRDAFHAARQYAQRWERWKREKTGAPPRVDLELQALAEVLSGERLVHCHSYRQDEILALMRTCEDFGVRLATFQHILEGYKVADVMREHGVGGSSFSDWWAYKFEVYDAIPYNGAILRDVGVLVSFNSDDAELARRMNLEAAKAVKYGGVPPAEALKFVTLNPAVQLGIDDVVGSLETGKDADLVVWSGSPLSSLSLCEQTWIDGRRYFDRQEDLQRRGEFQRMHNALVQRVLGAGEARPERTAAVKEKWPRTDVFCRGRDMSDFQEVHDR